MQDADLDLGASGGVEVLVDAVTVAPSAGGDKIVVTITVAIEMDPALVLRLAAPSTMG
jgi:hypothetical protein